MVTLVALYFWKNIPLFRVKLNINISRVPQKVVPKALLYPKYFSLPFSTLLYRRRYLKHISYKETTLITVRLLLRSGDKQE